MDRQYDQTLEFLYSLQKFGIKFGLSSTENLLEALGRPQDDLPVLHLAGTNGKGSTGAMVLSVLRRTGRRIGFFTSPHLVSFQERFAVADERGVEIISRREVVELCAEVRAACSPQEPPTFFEFVTAMAFVLFARQKVDLAIMETGMGGRLDATNVARPLVGVITNISLEHQNYLGRTLSEISGEKAGIIKPGMPVVTGEARPRIRDLFEETTRKQGGKLYALGRDFLVRRRPEGGFDYRGLTAEYKKLELSLMGRHQVKNAGLALAALELLAGHGLTADEALIREGLQNTHWPGRTQMFPGPPRLMLDGAHNPAAARTLAQVLTDMKYDRLHLILGIMADKDIRSVAAPLAPLADRLYLTRPSYFRAASPQAIVEAAGNLVRGAQLIEGVPQAIEAARAAAGPDDLVVVSGSLFTVGEALGWLEPGSARPDGL